MDKLELTHLLGGDGDNQSIAIISAARLFGRVNNLDLEDFLKNLDDFSTWDPQYIDKAGEEHGMHIMDAVRCLVDTTRTTRLLASISETTIALENAIDKPLTAIDAGTGTGVLAIGLVLSGVDKVFALEINHDSVSASRNFIEAVGMSENIEVIECDATKINLGSLNADILISENLSNGLFDEPQYQIINHLSAYMNYKGSVIPFGAELFASLGWSGWEQAKLDENHLTKRKLLDLEVLSEPSLYARVDSRVGEEVNTVKGRTRLDLLDEGKIPNALLVSTRFQLNELGTPVYLEPDTCEFLGKTTAFKIPGSVDINTGSVDVKLEYKVGIRKKFAKFTIEGNKIILIALDEQ